MYVLMKTFHIVQFDLDLCQHVEKKIWFVILNISFPKSILYILWTHVLVDTLEQTDTPK